MKTFSQFILEQATLLDEAKGWMSPSGKASPVKGQHAYEHHPEVWDKVDADMKKAFPKAGRNLSWEQKTQSVGMAQRRGYTRFGRESNLGYSYVHFDKDAPGGTESALHALRHLKPRFGETIHVGTKPDDSPRDEKFHSPGHAAHFIRTGERKD